MKNSLKVAALSALISATALVSQAQTNLVETLGIQFAILTQGVPITNGNSIIQTADTARFGTRDVINELGTATSNTFSRSAQLLRVTAITNGTNGGTTTVIKDGTNVVNVSGFFAFSTDGTVMKDSDSFKGKVLYTTRFSIRSLALKDQTGYPALTTRFTVQGFDTTTLERLALKDGLVIWGRSAYWTVNGTGDHGTKPTIVDESVTVNFLKIDTTGAD